MRIGVVTTRAHGESAGGAERFFDALIHALHDLGHEVHEVAVEADEPNFEQIKRNYLTCYDLDLSRFDIVVSTKAPTWMLRHDRHVCYLVHTIRVFYDMFEEVFGAHPAAEYLEQRNLIHKLDTGGLSTPRCKAVFTIGNEVSRRLREFNGIDAESIHPPLWGADFHEGDMGDYLFLPGRLHPWKRVDLIIRAMRHVRSDLKLRIAGTGESERDLRALASDDARIQFLGRIDDEQLRLEYAGCLAVPFAPKREDYGYVTLEAFASGKPVITCSDSGEAATIVKHGETGLVCVPDERSIAQAIEQLAGDRDCAKAMGAKGKAWVDGLSWDNVARRLVDAAMAE